ERLRDRPHHPPAGRAGQRRRGELAPVLVRAVRRRGHAEDGAPVGGHQRAPAGSRGEVRPQGPFLPGVKSPADVKRLSQEQLKQLAEELRSEIVRVCSIAGGHLASSLGAVELTVALHYLYDTSHDRV